MDLEGIMTSEICQTKRLYDFPCMWNIKNKTNEQSKQNISRVIDTENKRSLLKGKEEEERNR